MVGKLAEHGKLKFAGSATKERFFHGFEVEWGHFKAKDFLHGIPCCGETLKRGKNDPNCQSNRRIDDQRKSQSSSSKQFAILNYWRILIKEKEKNEWHILCYKTILKIWFLFHISHEISKKMHFSQISLRALLHAEHILDCNFTCLPLCVLFHEMCARVHVVHSRKLQSYIKFYFKLKLFHDFSLIRSFIHEPWRVKLRRKKEKLGINCLFCPNTCHVLADF